MEFVSLIHLTILLPFQPAEKRESEGWELMYGVGAVATLAILSIGLTYKPKNSIKVRTKS